MSFTRRGLLGFFTALPFLKVKARPTAFIHTSRIEDFEDRPYSVPVFLNECDGTPHGDFLEFLDRDELAAITPSPWVRVAHTDGVYRYEEGTIVTSRRGRKAFFKLVKQRTPS